MKLKEKKDMRYLKIKTKFILLSIFFFTLFGCERKQKESLYLKIIYAKETKINKRNIGKILFDSELDTVKAGEKDLKSTTLFLGKFKKRYAITELEKMHQSLDTFGFIEKKNDTIYFDYIFDKVGIFYLDGYIEEKILLDNYYKNGNSRLLTKQIKISEKIKVID